jgi:ABC-type multidrug transport system fused ATPase/permease subunit
LSWKLTIATVLLGVVLGGLSLLISRRALRLGRELATAGFELGRQVTETVGGLRVIRTTASESLRAKSFERWNRQHGDSEANVQVAQGIMLGTTESLGVAGAMGLTALAHAVWLAPGAMDVSRFLAFAFGLVRMLPALNQSYGLQTGVTALTGSTERTLKWLGLPRYPERPFGSRPLAEITKGVTFENVSFVYPGGVGGVQSVSFHVPAGQTLAVLGASGSGKSTLASLLLRLRELTDGRILIDGVDHWEFAPAEFHRAVALVEQEPFLFNGTIRENVAYGAPWVSEGDVLSAIARVQLKEFVEGLPQGLETMIGERGATMSGGQKQRLAIARAIVRDPRLLVLDEPTSALDDETEREVVQAIDAAREGRTTIVISHRPTTVEHADRTLSMRGGVIISDQERSSVATAGSA